MRKDAASPWPFVPLREVAEVQTGVAKNGQAPRGSVVRPYLRVANVQDGHLDLAEMKTIQIAEHEVCRYELQVGDVLMTEGGDFDKLGRGTIWRGEVPGCVHQNHVFAVRTNRERLLPEFLALVAESAHGRRYFLRCSKQSTNLASINSTQLRALPVPAAPLGIQAQIARRHRQLTRVDEVLSRLLDAKRRLKRALLEQLLSGRLRFPSGTAKSWHQTVLGRVGRVASGATPSTIDPTNWDGGVPWCTPTDVTRLKEPWLRCTSRTITKEGLASCGAELLPAGAVVVCTRATIGAVAIADVPVATNQGFKSIIPHESTNCLFLYYAVCAAKRELLRRAGGSTFPEVSKTAFESIPIMLPDLAEQERVASMLLFVDREIALLERELTAYRQLKRGLMQQLLTGALSLPSQAEPSRGVSVQRAVT